MNKRVRWVWLLLASICAAAVPIVAQVLRGTSPTGCALDGSAIIPIYRVRIQKGDRQFVFCCIRCAQLWARRQSDALDRVLVVDEATGVEIDAVAAIFVHSSVVTTPAAQNRIHAFRLRSDAEEHVAIFGGRLLTGDECPFP